jgi:hypothetical protein
MGADCSVERERNGFIPRDELFFSPVNDFKDENFSFECKNYKEYNFKKEIFKYRLKQIMKNVEIKNDFTINKE